MSYYTMALVGMTPFGSLLAGSLAHLLGAPHTVIITGSIVILGGIWFASQLPAIHRAIHPIYQAMGIVPAAPIETVVEDAAG